MSPKAIIFTILLVTAGGSIAARAMLADEQPAATSTSAAAATAPPGGTGLVPDGPRTTPPATTPPDQQTEGMASALPYVSEASFFAIIGFALGYASKKVLKVGLIVLALFFVGLQVMSYQGIVTIDWQAAVDFTNRVILNINENDTVGEVIKNRLPGAGGLVVGYALGFRKG